MGKGGRQFHQSSSVVRRAGKKICFKFHFVKPETETYYLDQDRAILKYQVDTRYSKTKTNLTAHNGVVNNRNAHLQLHSRIFL